MTELNSSRMGCGILLLCIATAIAAPAQQFKNLANFSRAKGTLPKGALVQGVNGDLYGTAFNGGASYCGGIGCGTVFEISPASITAFYSFCSQPNCMDGNGPTALMQAANGNFYGTTYFGGAEASDCPSGLTGCGTVFEITRTGDLTTLYSFCSQSNCADGWGPLAGLVQGTDGNFYGTTTFGGANTNGSYCSNGCGTIFEVTPTGKFTTLYSFCSQPNCIDGWEPVAGLVQGTDGNFYGTTERGGTVEGNNLGTVFEITPAGKLTTLHSFCSQTNCTDGEYPEAALVQATNGNFYGTTVGGGANSRGGTVFEITPAGQLTTLYSFCLQSDCTDGDSPNGLIQASDGNFYDTTNVGGANGRGEIFEITPSGQLTILYSFCSVTNCDDGASPLAGVMQDTDGTFYGTTEGARSLATLFSLSVGLGPFVQTLPGAGKVGTQTGVLGTDLKGATSVTFNGTATTFTVKSSTLILTRVPPGATTGYVTVTTPTGVLKSNVPFRVIQ